MFLLSLTEVVSGSRSCQVVVFASVQQGQDAVLGAEVEATIQRLDPDSGRATNSSSQLLLDNGAGIVFVADHCVAVYLTKEILQCFGTSFK